MRNVFITGANRGLGLSLVRVCLSAGDRVFAGTHQESPAISLLRAEHQAALHTFPLDVTEEDSVRAAQSEVAGRVDGLDLLINCAAILLRETTANPVENLDFDSMRKTIEVNVYGPLRVLKHFLPLLSGRPRAVIVNISSEAGSIADCNRDTWYDYCISKAGLNMASKILQNYLKARSIKVLAVHPGWMRTRMGGPGALREPEESAKAILDLAARRWDMDDPIYIDYAGTPMRW